MLKTAEIPSLLLELWTDLHDIKVLWQAGAALVCLLVAWGVSRALSPRLAAGDAQKHLGHEALATILFPAVALGLAFAARAALGGTTQNLLNMLIALLTAAIIIRLVVLMLRQVFAPSGWRDSLMRVIAVTVWVGFAVYIAGLLPDLLRFLDSLGFSVGKHRISLFLILRGLASVLATLLIALWVGRLIEVRAMAATDLDINLRVMISKLAQALLVLAAILFALPAVGIDLTVLSVFGGALGVGLGFGLQKIASNYISGFIILLDRSVSLGDLVTIDNHTGQLTKMTARYVVVRSLTGVESIIPNDTLITSTVINQSYTDKNVRQAIGLQVGYDCSPEQAMRLMIDAAAAQPRILKDPAPKAFLTRFADSGIELELGFWVDDPQAGTQALKSDLQLAIWRTFREHRIEIPYPQRVVRLASTPARMEAPMNNP